MTTSLSLIVPAYNEVVAVQLFGEMLLSTKLTDHLTEIVFVDDGSSDGTWEAMQELARANDCVRVVKHASNQGLGGAIRSGVVAARAQRVCWVPIDQQIRLTDVLGITLDNPDTPTILFRRITSQGSHRKLLSCFVGIAFKLLFGSNVSNQSGVFVMPRELFLNHPMITTRGISLGELLIRLQKSHTKLKVVDLECFPRNSSQSKTFSLRSVLRSLRELVGLILIDPSLLKRRNNPRQK